MLTDHIPLPDCSARELRAQPVSGNTRWSIGFVTITPNMSSVTFKECGTVGWHDRDAALAELRARINVYRTLAS